MKKHSINRWVTRCFIIILLVSMTTSALFNLSEAYCNTMQEMRERATICAKNISHLLQNQWNLEELSASSDSDTYRLAHQTLRVLCKDCQMQYLYIYRIDMETSSRYFYLIASDDTDADTAVQKELALKNRPLTEQPLSGELAILSGQDGGRGFL